MKRRNFLKQSALLSASPLIPSFLKHLPSISSGTRNGKILVVIQLSGGNDGLNSIVPYSNDLYHKLRPRLGYHEKDVIKLNDEMGFQPGLAMLESLFKDGEMTILNQVGYPNPDRSHFRSMDIWQTASGSESYLKTGWLGRCLDSNCNDNVAHAAIEIGANLSLSLKGEKSHGFAFKNIKQLNKATRNKFHQNLTKQHQGQSNEKLSYLYKVLIDTQESAYFLNEKVSGYSGTIDYPKNNFSKDLKTIAELITTDVGTNIYYANLGGFDTHVNQKFTQKRLLDKYAESIHAFVADLKANNLWDDTLIFTFSEFGRRVKQNASGGTDHGTANNVYLMGGSLKKPGFYNKAPDLANLDNGDLKYSIDFRDIYSDILNNWLDISSETILGRKQGDISLFG